MNAPDPKANTTTEAYLAYKAGYLEESELKPKLYEPYLHFDGWLAYWAGLVNTYPTKENGDPEMLCDEEALVAYLSGVTGTYPEEIKDPYDVRIVGYLRHLVSIRWPEPDYPVNNEEFYLSTMEPTHTSNAEPSADIELDTAEGKIISVEAYGDTYQQIYSGYNLIDLVPMTNTQPNAYQQCTLETVMDTTLGRNVLHITGAGNYPSVVYQLSKRLESGKYYVLKFTYRSSINDTATNPELWFAPNWSANNWDVLGSLTNDHMRPGDGDTTATTPQSTNWRTTCRRFYVDPSRYSSVDTSYSKICFSLGYNSDATKELWLADAEEYEITEDEWNADTYTSIDYEPYTGGIPAPNPDYPQDVQVVTGAQTMKITGRNLLRLVQLNNPSQGITATVNNDGSITVSGTASSTWANLTDISTGITLSSGGTYTFSIDKMAPVSIGLVSTGIARQDFNIAPGRTSVTATANYDNTGLHLYIFNLTQNQSYDFTIYPQFEKGSRVTAYEPFHSQTYTVDLGSIELYKIGNHQDKIFNNDPNEDWYNPDLEDNAWYVHKETNAKTIDGTESGWGKSGVTENNAYYLSNDIFNDMDRDGMGINQFDTHITPTVSRYFLATSSNNIFTTDAVGLGFNAQPSPNQRLDLRIGVGLSSPLNTLQLFKDWLALNPVTVYYVLATATDTKITDATLIGQLEALAGADTYNEKTFIEVTATGSNLPALLKVEAYRY